MSTTKTKWEYAVTEADLNNTISSKIEIKLNVFGQLGWQLVTIIPCDGTHKIIFKREIKTDE